MLIGGEVRRQNGRMKMNEVVVRQGYPKSELTYMKIY